MPRTFYFPNRDIQLWTAIRLKADNYGDRNDNWLEAVGRLRPGVSVAQALSEMAVVTAQLERQYPKENEGTHANVYLLRDDVSTQSRLLLYALEMCIRDSASSRCATLAHEIRSTHPTAPVSKYSAGRTSPTRASRSGIAVKPSSSSSGASEFWFVNAPIVAAMPSCAFSNVTPGRRRPTTLTRLM